jgi:hypothetical protein
MCCATDGRRKSGANDARLSMRVNGRERRELKTPAWFFSKTDDFKGSPYILVDEYFKPKKKKKKMKSSKRMTWYEQIRFVKQNGFEYCIELIKACEDTVDAAMKWLNRAYAHMVIQMEPLLDNPKYREQWGWPPAQRDNCGTASEPHNAIESRS